MSNFAILQVCLKMLHPPRHHGSRCCHQIKTKQETNLKLSEWVQSLRSQIYFKTFNWKDKVTKGNVESFIVCMKWNMHIFMRYWYVQNFDTIIKMSSYLHSSFGVNSTNCTGHNVQLSSHCQCSSGQMSSKTLLFFTLYFHFKIIWQVVNSHFLLLLKIQLHAQFYLEMY